MGDGSEDVLSQEKPERGRGPENRVRGQSGLDLTVLSGDGVAGPECSIGSCYEKPNFPCSADDGRRRSVFPSRLQCGGARTECNAANGCNNSARCGRSGASHCSACGGCA